MAATGAELGVVVAFGQILPVALLDSLPSGFVNVHFSLLPRWRGAAPVERAILAGDSETGVDIMAIEAGLDTGPVFASARTPIDPAETAGELHARLVEMGTDLLLATLPDVPTIEPRPQVGEPTYAEKLTVEEFELDPSAPPAELARAVRAGNPRPGAWIPVDGKRLKVWRGAHRRRSVRARRGPARRKAADAVHRVAHRSPRRGTVRVTTTPREVALEALVRVEEGAYANVLLPGLLRTTGLEQRERAQTTELVYGTLRRRRSLDALLEPVLDRDLDDLDPPVRAALRLGVYQLVEGVAPHAAVGETVGALGRVAPRAKGFVNAVLRRVADLGPPWPWPQGDSVHAVGVRTSMPDWIVDRMFTDLGVEDGRAAVEIANEPPALTLRVNPRRAGAADVEAELVAAGAGVERGVLLPDALIVRGGGDPGQIPAVVDGRATRRTRAARPSRSRWVPARATGCWKWAQRRAGRRPHSRRRWTTAARWSPSTSTRAAWTWCNAATRRLGLRSVHPVAADGRQLPSPAASFDRVLLDAPCSGLGVLRRRAEARWRIEPAAVDELAALQRDLLASAAALVRPGGRLVYSVCTLTRAETVDVDEWARRALPELVADPAPAGPWRAWGRGALLLPQAAGTDGMYLLTLTRSPDPSR